MAAARKDGRQWLGKVAGLLGLAALGGVVGALAAIGGAKLAPLRAALDSLGALSAWDVLLLPLLWLFAVGVHEAGHLFAGMARGMRFLMFVVGPVGLVRAGGRLRLRRFFNLGALAGFAVALPDPARPLRPQMMSLALGGPLASLALALLAAWLATRLDGRLAAWAVLTAALSTALFAMTAIPLRAGGFLSDGMQFLQLRRDPRFLQRRANLVALMGLGLSGTRPAALDPALLERAQAATGDEAMYDVAAWIYSFHHALDHGEVGAAGAWLDRIEPLFAQYPDGFRQGIAVEFALFEALHRQRTEVAARWLALARGGVVDTSRRALAEAAVAARERRTADAQRLLAVAEQALPRAIDPGLALLSRDQIASLRAATAAGAAG